MGLPALWDTIKHHEESVLIAQLAEDHHRRHGKPLRIAVDEADWRFNNLTPQQVYTIRETSNEQAFQGIEKAMFYRICRLLTLNIQLIFVFDGPGRPWKRGKRGGGQIDYEKRRLLQQMLRCFGIPHHDAPGEAEAECARLQVLGIVDAVWSQDSDCLMFGCTLWIHDDRVAKDKDVTNRSKDNTKKNGKYARVVQAQDLENKHGLDRQGLVLFAMLVGGDYDPKGLPQCGPAIAMQAVRQGLGRSLCACTSQRDCDSWSMELALFLQTTARGRTILVPPGFPSYKTLQKYYCPKVTCDQALLNNSRLNLDYIRPIQEKELLEVTSSRFNIWGRLYFNWVGPVLLTRDLSARNASLPKEVIHDLKLTRRRVTKTDDGVPTRVLERKLSFSPFGVTELNRADFEGARLGYWNGDITSQFDPAYRVECEYPVYWLQKVLPVYVLDPPPSLPKSTLKRTREAEDVGSLTNTKRKRQVKQTDSSVTQNGARLLDRELAASTTPTRSIISSKLRNTPLSESTREILGFLDLSEAEDEECLPCPSRNGSEARSSPRPTTYNIIDLSSPSQRPDADEPARSHNNKTVWSRFGQSTEGEVLVTSDEEDEDLQLAIRLSMQEQGHDSTSTPRRGGKYDSIFAMREAGRDVHGVTVPAWSLDETVNRPPAFTAPLSRTQTSTRVTLPGVIGVEPPSVSTLASALPATISTQSTSFHPARSHGAEAINRVSNNSPSVNATAADIRAARLRHFAKSTKVQDEPNEEGHTSSPAGAPCRSKESGYQIPDGADCIDLTGD